MFRVSKVFVDHTDIITADYMKLCIHIAARAFNDFVDRGVILVGTSQELKFIPFPLIFPFTVSPSLCRMYNSPSSLFKYTVNFLV